MKQILNKYLSLLFFIGFVVNTSALSKESESSNLMMASDYYGSIHIIGE